MRALAIDSCSPCLTIAAINEELYSSTVLDIGMHQSEKILIEIQKVLADVNLPCGSIQFASLCLGPGSFTSLRLAYAALKGLELNFGFPIYAYDSLYACAFPFLKLNKTTVSVIDAKKHRFYVAIYRNGEISVSSKDLEVTEIAKLIDAEEEVLLTGHDSEYFEEQFLQINPNQNFINVASRNINVAWQLLKLGEKDFCQHKSGIKEYDGPAYIRLSEAEEKSLNSK